MRQRLLEICDAHDLWLPPNEPKQLVTKDLHRLIKRNQKAPTTSHEIVMSDLVQKTTWKREDRASLAVRLATAVDHDQSFNPSKIPRAQSWAHSINHRAQSWHEAVPANSIGGPWCRVVDKHQKATPKPKFRGGKVVESEGLCWHRVFVERVRLEFEAAKNPSVPPVLSLEAAHAMAAKGARSRRNLAKYSFVVDTQGQRCYWSDELLQCLNALRFQKRLYSGQEAIQENDLMILAAEKGIDPDNLFPPLKEPKPHATGNSVPVPADFLQRAYARVGNTYPGPPKVPPLPQPDLKTMCTSRLPMEMGFLTRHGWQSTEEEKEEYGWHSTDEPEEEEEEEHGLMEEIEDEIMSAFDFLVNAPEEAPRPLSRSDILDITHGPKTMDQV